MSAVQLDSAETRTLLQQVRSGEGRAFDELFNRHRPYLRQFVGLRLDPRLRRRVDPSDIVQETHVEALQRLNAFLERPSIPFRLWLRQIAYDRTLKARRQHLGTARRDVGREVPLPARSSLVFAERLLAAGSTPSQQLGRAELARQVRQAMARLPEADQELLVMRHFEGLSNQEIGCVLEIDADTVSKRHGRAMLRLQKALFEGGIAGHKKGDSPPTGE